MNKATSTSASPLKHLPKWPAEIRSGRASASMFGSPSPRGDGGGTGDSDGTGDGSSEQADGGDADKVSPDGSSDGGGDTEEASSSGSNDDPSGEGGDSAKATGSEPGAEAGDGGGGGGADMPPPPIPIKGLSNKEDGCACPPPGNPGMDLRKMSLKNADKALKFAWEVAPGFCRSDSPPKNIPICKTPMKAPCCCACGEEKKINVHGRVP